MIEQVKKLYFIDFEFIERGPDEPIKMISIGIKASDGRSYYAVSSEFSDGECGLWLKENVLPHLGNVVRKTNVEIAKEIKQFVFEGDKLQGPRPRFWGYFSDYDWVVFCQLFGTMLDLPEGFPMFCLDLKQVMEMFGILKEQLPVQKGIAHNALADATWIHDAYQAIRDLTLEEGALRQQHADALRNFFSDFQTH